MLFLSFSFSLVCSSSSNFFPLLCFFFFFFSHLKKKFSRVLQKAEKKKRLKNLDLRFAVSSQVVSFFFVLFLSLLSSLLVSINNTHTTHTLEKRRRQKRENRFYRKKTEEIETLSRFSPSCSSSFVVVSLGYIYIIIIIRKRD